MSMRLPRLTPSFSTPGSGPTDTRLGPKEKGPAHGSRVLSHAPSGSRRQGRTTRVLFPRPDASIMKHAKFVKRIFNRKPCPG